MKRQRFFMAAVAVLTCFVASQAHAQSSSWPRFRHDSSHTGRTPYTGPAVPNVDWVFTVGDGIASSATLGEDGTIYFGVGWYYASVADSNLYALNPDGSLKWTYKANYGIFASPAVGPDGTVYFSALDSYVYALEDSITYAKLRWKTDINFLVYSSPAIGADGTVYAGSLDFNFYALDPAGNIKWVFPTGWCVFSSPAIGPDGCVYFGSKDHNVYAVEDSVTYGKLRWKHPTGTFFDGHLVDSSPAIGPDGTIYVGTDPYGAAGQTPVPVDTVFWAINPDGSLKWKFVMQDGAESSPAVGPDGMIYVGSYDGNLYAIRDEGDEGVLEWAFQTGGWVDASPTVDGCGTIYVGSRDSTLYAINPNGSLRWSYKTAGDIEASATIDDNGVLYVGDFAGNFYAFTDGGADVGVASIGLPAEVETGSEVIPTATVRNYRSGTQAFGVSCTIDTAGHNIYGDTVFVSGLSEITSTQVAFGTWSVGPDTGVVYDVTVTALLGGDGNGYNDKLTARVASKAETDTATQDDTPAPARVYLSQCYPNPFNPTTTIEFTLSETGPVNLKIYDVSGTLVRTLVNEAALTAEVTHKVQWDGRDDDGRPAPSGVYFYRLVSGNAAETRKMVLLK